MLRANIDMAESGRLAKAGQRVWHILDFWHACDHLVKIGKERYREGSEKFATCYERWRSMLWQGCAAGVINELKRFHASGRYTEKQSHDIQGEINYLTENQERWITRCIGHSVCRSQGW